MTTQPPQDSTDASPTVAMRSFSQVYDRLKAMAGKRLAGGPRDAGYHRAGPPACTFGSVPIRASASPIPTSSSPTLPGPCATCLLDRLGRRQRAGGDWIQITLTGSDSRLAL